MTKRIVSKPGNKAARLRQERTANRLATIAAKTGREGFKKQGTALKRSRTG